MTQKEMISDFQKKFRCAEFNRIKKRMIAEPQKNNRDA